MKTLILFLAFLAIVGFQAYKFYELSGAYREAQIELGMLKADLKIREATLVDLARRHDELNDVLTKKLKKAKWMYRLHAEDVDYWQDRTFACEM